MNPNDKPTPDMQLLLLSLMQVLEAGVKRHFRAATFGSHDILPDIGMLTFHARVLGINFEINARTVPENKP